MSMGQYAGNNQNYPPVVALPDDSDPLDASELNVGGENQIDRSAFLALRTRGNPGQNWQGGFLSWSGSSVNKTPFLNTNQPVWDGVYGQWLMSAQDSTGTWFVSQSFDGYVWNSLNGTYGANTTNTGQQVNTGIVVRPSDGLVMAYSASAVATFNQATQTWTTSFIGASLTVAAYGVYLAGSANVFVWFVCPLLSFIPAPVWSPDGVTINTAATWVPGAGFTVNPYGLVSATTAPVPYVAAFSGTAQHGAYATSTDGSNWTNVGMPILLIGERVVGAVWDLAAQALYGGANGGLFFLVSSPTQARLFGQGGVLISTIPHPCTGLATNNGELITVAQFGTSGATPQYRVIQSVDLGVTWQLTNNFSDTNPASFTGTGGGNFGLVGSGGQFLYTINTSSFARTSVSGQLPQLPF